jgi:hypothetical protein
MKVEVLRAEFFASVGRDQHFVRQHAVLVVGNFQCTQILCLGGGAFVAAGY